MTEPEAKPGLDTYVVALDKFEASHDSQELREAFSQLVVRSAIMMVTEWLSRSEYPVIVYPPKTEFELHAHTDSIYCRVKTRVRVIDYGKEAPREDPPMPDWMTGDEPMLGSKGAK